MRDKINACPYSVRILNVPNSKLLQLLPAVALSATLFPSAIPDPKPTINPNFKAQQSKQINHLPPLEPSRCEQTCWWLRRPQEKGPKMYTKTISYSDDSRENNISQSSPAPTFLIHTAAKTVLTTLRLPATVRVRNKRPRLKLGRH